MPLVNYHTVSLRDSAATTADDADDVGATTILPQTVKSCSVRLQKTAENHTDDLLSVRLQCRVGTADWVDVSWNAVQILGATATAADTALNVTRTPNICDADTTAAFTYVADYENLLSNVVRIVWVASGGAGFTVTFEADATFRVNDL